MILETIKISSGSTLKYFKNVTVMLRKLTPKLIDGFQRNEGLQ